jgi:hypothetical protein
MMARPVRPDVPLIKGTSGVLCLRDDEAARFEGGSLIRWFLSTLARWAWCPAPWA